MGVVGAVAAAATATYVLKSSKKTLATGADSVDALVKRCHEQMEARTGELYLKFDQDRKQREALEADQQDEADLKALETKIKRRPKK